MESVHSTVCAGRRGNVQLLSAVGHDVPEETWVAGLRAAVDSFDQGPHILQEFHKAARLPLRYYDFYNDEIVAMHGRVLLRPYYYIHGQDARLAGIQAIACPADKKVLHGMSDAVLVPCAVGASPQP